MEKLKNYYGFKLAIFFFIVGTLFLISYLIFKDETIILLGYFYVLASVIANVVIVIALSIQLFTKKNNKEKIFINIALLCVNIPIAITYFLIVINTL